MGKTEKEDDSIPLQIENKSNTNDPDHSLKPLDNLPNEKKIESLSDAAQHEKGNIGNDALQEKDNTGNDTNLSKKRKKECTEDDPESRNEKKKKQKSKSKPKPQNDNLLRGKRFTPEEDEIVKEAVLDYIKTHDLGDEGLKKIINCRSHPELKNCWKEIGACIPYRPFSAVYYRAHILFERAEKREWTAEEAEFIKKSYEKHGNNWKLVAEELGKHRIHVKDKWRRIKLPNKKKGRWSQEEYQGLYDLVNVDLQIKVSQEKNSKHGMLRDNIPWTAISEKLSTRNDATCCRKWYAQLTSSLVNEGKWSNADDYRMIRVLYDLDAACVEDVDWGSVVENRSGEVCRKRWDQMVRNIGHNVSKPFSEQVEILSKRYCPDLAEVREEWDSRPFVN